MTMTMKMKMKMKMKTRTRMTKIRRRTSRQKSRNLRRRTRCRWRRWPLSTKEIHAYQVSFGFLDIFVARLITKAERMGLRLVCQ